MDEITRRLNAGEMMAVESRHRRKDGTVFPVEVRGKAFWEGGRPYLVTTARDISERKRLEEELRKAHARLELAVRGSNITLLELNMPDGVLENSRLELISVGNQTSGYDPSELETEFAAAMARVHPDDRERVVRAMRAHLSGQTREYEAEYRIRQKDGSYSWRLARGVAVRD